MEKIAWLDFEKIEMRVGTIVLLEDFPEARNPSYKIVIDFGEGMGLKKSSAQITKLYTKEELVGKQVIAVVNFPPKQIGNYMSECLILGAVGNEQEIVLLQPERTIPDGTRIA